VARSKAEYTPPRILSLDTEEVIKILGPASGYGAAGGDLIGEFASGGSGGTRDISQR
jgi:hypothetical protein